MKKKMLASVLALTTVLSTTAGVPLGAKADEDPYEVVMVIPTLGSGALRSSGCGKCTE